MVTIAPLEKKNEAAIEVRKGPDPLPEVKLAGLEMQEQKEDALEKITNIERNIEDPE